MGRPESAEPDFYNTSTNIPSHSGTTSITHFYPPAPPAIPFRFPPHPKCVHRGESAASNASSNTWSSGQSSPASLRNAGELSKKSAKEASSSHALQSGTLPSGSHPHRLPPLQVPRCLNHHLHHHQVPANQPNVLPPLPTTTNRTPTSRSFFCFGLLMVHSTFVTLVIFDLLLLSHSLIFTISNYLNRKNDGNEFGSEATGTRESAGLVIASSTLPYNLLLPLFGVQVFWLVSAILALISLKTVQPYLLLPYLFSSGIVLFATTWLIIQTIEALATSITVEWALALTLSFANVVFLVQLYFLYIKVVCVRTLIRKRKSLPRPKSSVPPPARPNGTSRRRVMARLHTNVRDRKRTHTAPNRLS